MALARPVWGTRIPLASRIGAAVSRYAQAWSERLHELAGIRPGDSVIPVGNGSGWVGESGATLRTSIGVGTGNAPQFAGLSTTVAGTTASPSIFFQATGAMAEARILGLDLPGDTTDTADFFIYFSDAAGVVGSISGDTGSAVKYNTTSDAARKANIRDAAIGDARAIVRALVERDWDNAYPGSPPNGGRGYVAQELHAVYPEAVTPGRVVQREDGSAVEVPWMISPMSLIPVLARALREQDAAIAALESRLAALEAP